MPGTFGLCNSYLFRPHSRRRSRRIPIRECRRRRQAVSGAQLSPKPRKLVMLILSGISPPLHCIAHDIINPMRPTTVPRQARRFRSQDSLKLWKKRQADTTPPHHDRRSPFFSPSSCVILQRQGADAQARMVEGSVLTQVHMSPQTIVTVSRAAIVKFWQRPPRHHSSHRKQSMTMKEAMREARSPRERETTVIA